MSYKKSDYALALVLTVFLITAAVIVAVFEPFIFRFDLDLYNLANRVGLARDAVISNYNILIDYQSLFHTGPLVMPDFSMSTSGEIHFGEVKNIFGYIQLVAMGSFVLGTAGMIHRFTRREYRFLNLTSYMVVIIPSVIAISAVGNFDKAFVFFHQLVFNNDYWIFDERTDPVIGILPEGFFFHKFILIVVLIFVFAGILQLVYRYYQNRVIQKS